MKGIYFYFYCRRSCYLYIPQDICFYFTRKKFYWCHSHKSVKVLESPGTLMQKVLKKQKNVLESPGKSWNSNKFFWWEPWLWRNIARAGTQHFKEKRNCDVLDSEQGPSCMRLDQLPSLNLIFIRFTTPASIKNFVLLNHGLYHLWFQKYINNWRFPEVH